MNRGLFQDFVSSPTEWAKLVESELKKPGAAETLPWQIDEGFTIQPYQEKYLNNTVEKLADAISALVLRPAENEFYNTQSFDATADGLNKKLRDALDGGINGLMISGDLATDQVPTILAGIFHEVLWMDFTGKQPANIISGLHQSLKNRNVDPALQLGSIGLQPFQDFAAKGELSSLEDLKTHLEQLDKTLPSVKGICIDAGLIANAGGTITQQIAFALSQGNEYLQWGLENGFTAEKIAEKLHFRFAFGPNFLLESVKVRSFKWLWNRILSEYDVKNTRTFVSSVTSSFYTGIYDSHNNLLRYTTATLSAIIGGSDAHSVLNFDHEYKETSAFSERISRNITNLLLEESFLGKVQNVTHGSFAFDNIQYQVCEHSWELFKSWEKAGGYLKALENGVIQSAIQTSAEALIAKFNENKIVVLGVNKYPNKNERKGTEWPGKPAQANNNKCIVPFRLSEQMELERVNQEAVVS